MINPVDIAVITTIVRDTVISVGVIIVTGCVLKFAVGYGVLKQYFTDLATEARAWASRLTDNHLRHIQEATEETAKGIAELKSDLRVAASLVVAAKETENIHHDELMDGLNKKK